MEVACITPKEVFAKALATASRLMKTIVLMVRHDGYNKNIRRTGINESICNSFNRRNGNFRNMRYLRRCKKRQGEFAFLAILFSDGDLLFDYGSEVGNEISFVKRALQAVRKYRKW